MVMIHSICIDGDDDGGYGDYLQHLYHDDDSDPSERT